MVEEVECGICLLFTNYNFRLTGIGNFILKKLFCLYPGIDIC